MDRKHTPNSLCESQAGILAIKHGINVNVIPKWLRLYRDQPATPSPAFVPLKAAPKRPAEASVIIKLPMAGQLITVKWPASDSEDCAQFIRIVARWRSLLSPVFSVARVYANLRQNGERLCDYSAHILI
ncbi:hypothetical protein HX881_02145 [Pseudomonas gingeri]|uniref:hypothetical protein n=1 Tax=Pseudomonas gingeri TaxID=117681 RepID=UPI0015A2E8A1|nr:hypothetical protein [Pseudomonas gingeri]NVZ24332.1 hypothetical protein [Pseudomonas gingeri]